MRCILLFLFPLLLASCHNTNRQQSSTASVSAAPDRPKIEIPSFNKDSAYAYVGHQVSFGPRVPGSPAHENCADYISG